MCAFYENVVMVFFFRFTDDSLHKYSLFKNLLLILIILEMQYIMNDAFVLSVSVEKNKLLLFLRCPDNKNDKKTLEMGLKFCRSIKNVSCLK